MSILAKYAHILDGQASASAQQPQQEKLKEQQKLPASASTSNEDLMATSKTAGLDPNSKAVRLRIPFDPAATTADTTTAEEQEDNNQPFYFNHGTLVVEWRAEDSLEDDGEDEASGDSDGASDDGGGAGAPGESSCEELPRKKTRHRSDYDYDDPFIDDDEDYFIEQLMYRPETPGYFAWKGAVPSVIVQDESEDESEESEGEEVPQDAAAADEQMDIVQEAVAVEEPIVEPAEQIASLSQVTSSAPTEKKKQKRKEKPESSENALSVSIAAVSADKSDALPIASPMEIDEGSKKKKIKLASPSPASAPLNPTVSVVLKESDGNGSLVDQPASSAPPSQPATPAKSKPRKTAGTASSSKQLSPELQDVLTNFLASIADKWSFPAPEFPVSGDTETGQQSAEGAANQENADTTAGPSKKQAQAKLRVKQLDNIKTEFMECMSQLFEKCGGWVMGHVSREAKLFWKMLSDSMGVPVATLKKSCDTWMLPSMMSQLELQIYYRAGKLKQLSIASVHKLLDNWSKKMEKYQSDMSALESGSQQPNENVADQQRQPEAEEPGEDPNAEQTGASTAPVTKQRKPRKPSKKFQFTTETRNFLDLIHCDELLRVAMRRRWKQIAKNAMLPRGGLSLLADTPDDQILGNGIDITALEMKSMMSSYTLFSDNSSVYNTLTKDGKGLNIVKIQQKLSDHLFECIKRWIAIGEEPGSDVQLAQADVSRQFGLVKRQPGDPFELLIADKFFGFHTEVVASASAAPTAAQPSDAPKAESTSTETIASETTPDVAPITST